jgi:hypothetical protein
MTNSLFDPQETDQPQIDQSKNYLEDLVGEGKKFKDAEALAKGKWYSDAMIEIQNKRMDQIRKDYLELKAESDARARLEDLLDKMDNKQLPKPDTHVPEVKDDAPAITQSDIEKMVSQKITETRSQEKAEQNFNTVMSKLKERFGTNYRDALLEQTENLGLTIDDVNTLARKSPTAFFKTMGLDVSQPQQQSFQAPPRTSQSFAPQGKPAKTWAYYQDLFKKNPKLYYDPKITQQMVESATELGDKFQDGDFKVYGDQF